MPVLTKSKTADRLAQEKHFVAALRYKLDALANAQLKEDRQASKILKSAAKRVKKTKPQSISHLKSEIHLLLSASNIQPHRPRQNVPLATREESWLIRLDWDGKFHQPADTDFSEAYARERQIYMEQLALDDTQMSFPLYQPQAYELHTSPTWLFMRRFQNYANSAKYICEQLSRQNISPETVQKMNFFDFSNVLYNWMKENNRQPFESARSRNIKMFEACYGNEFAEIMELLDYKPEYISRMRQKMRNGNTDPMINFHHNINVSRFKELDEPHKINRFSNMLLTFVQPHHRILHFGNGYEAPRDIVFFGGFDPLYQIRRNPERERQYLQTQKLAAKAIKDAKYSR